MYSIAESTLLGLVWTSVAFQVAVYVVFSRVDAWKGSKYKLLYMLGSLFATFFPVLLKLLFAGPNRELFNVFAVADLFIAFLITVRYVVITYRKEKAASSDSH